MSGVVQLVSSYVLPGRLGGRSVIRCTAQVNGVLFRFERPLVEIGGELAIGPVLDISAGHLTWRLDRWMGLDLVSSGWLPVWVGSQVGAARMAREFEACPRVGWDSSWEVKKRWCEQWLESNPEFLVLAPKAAAAGGAR